MAIPFNMSTSPAGMNLLLLFKPVAVLSRFLYTGINYNFASDYRNSLARILFVSVLKLNIDEIHLLTDPYILRPQTKSTG